jgi:hypothetical protein
VAGLLGATLSPIFTASPALADVAAPAVFTSPGTYSYTVPAGVTQLLVHAAGGTGASGVGLPGLGGVPGAAAIVEGSLTVIPGQSFTVVVGGAGNGTTGGYGGGGSGGVSSNLCCGNTAASGGGGGGASSILTGGAPQLSAGGGGGGGGGNTQSITGPSRPATSAATAS